MACCKLFMPAVPHALPRTSHACTHHTGMRPRISAAHLHLLIAGEQVGHLARVEQVVDVLHKRLVLDGAVAKQKHERPAVDARAAQQALDVLAPLGHAVVLADLDLQQGEAAAEAHA